MFVQVLCKTYLFFFGLLWFISTKAKEDFWISSTTLCPAASPVSFSLKMSCEWRTGGVEFCKPTLMFADNEYSLVSLEDTAKAVLRCRPVLGGTTQLDEDFSDVWLSGISKSRRRLLTPRWRAFHTHQREQLQRNNDQSRTKELSNILNFFLLTSANSLLFETGSSLGFVPPHERLLRSDDAGKKHLSASESFSVS